MKFLKIFLLLTSIFPCEIYSQEKVIEKYENGNLKFEGYSKNKILDSVYKEYYENGNLKAEGFYKNCKYETNKRKIFVLGCGVSKKIDSLISGTNHGNHKTYYQNGKLQSISNFHCGLMQGNFYNYYENGNLEMQEFYFEGKLKMSQSFNEKGFVEEINNIEYRIKKKLELETKNHKEFYENGDLKIENIIVEEENDIIEYYKEYYRNGFLKTEKTLKNNSKNGIYREYFENGNAKYEGKFNDDKPIEKQYFYNENGTILKIETWKKNRMINSTNQ
jgi:antitoxin component YwqK of YwqJK toxin-antitoxin module